MPPGRSADLAARSCSVCNCSASLQAKAIPASASLVISEGSCVFMVNESDRFTNWISFLAEDKNYRPRQKHHQACGNTQMVTPCKRCAVRLQLLNCSGAAKHGGEHNGSH